MNPKSNKPNAMEQLLQQPFKANSPNVEASNQEETLASPSSEVPMQGIDIFYLEPYENNPRKAENDKFEDIKESIRNVGLESQFSITLRPGAKKYIIRSGGNTRLKALKMLYEETKEDRFRYIDCRFVPFTNDLDLLSLHMVENELRGRMLFIDTATAVKEFKDLFEKENSTMLTQRELSNEMNKRGWKIQQSHLGFYLFACEIIDYLPIAFSQGMGRTTVIAIRKLEGHLTKWANEKNRDKQRVIQYFRNVLKENDAPALDLKYIEESVIQRLASEFNLNTKDVKESLKLIKTDGSLINIDEDEGNGTNSTVSFIAPQIEQTAASQDSEANVARSSNVQSMPPNAASPCSQPLSDQSTVLGSQDTKVLFNRAKYQVKDHIRNIINSIDNFNEMFEEVNDDTLFRVLISPNQLIDERGQLPEKLLPQDASAIYFALYMRIKILEATVKFKNNPTESLNQIRNFMSYPFYEKERSLIALIPCHFLSVTTSTLPEFFKKTFTGFLSLEVQEAFNSLTELDQKIHDYLSLLD